MSQVHEAVNALTDAHYLALKFVAGHLRRVAKNAAQNEMDIHELATIFGPILMGSEWVDEQESVVSGDTLQDIHEQCKIVETILMNYKEIFD